VCISGSMGLVPPCWQFLRAIVAARISRPTRDVGGFAGHRCGLSFFSLPAPLLLASGARPYKCFECRYETPLFADASAKPLSRDNSCGAVIYTEKGSSNHKT
jgi:hypothetical protein